MIDSRPHDLLWIRGGDDVVSRTPLPGWASDEWLAIAPVVVRRECTKAPFLLPVGLRGRMRSERHAAHVRVDRVVRRVTPELLAEEQAWTRCPEVMQIPCIHALSTVIGILESRHMRWGITGSAGFTLGSGIPVVRGDSDLDVLIRAPTRMSRDEAADLVTAFGTVPIRIDAQIDTGAGAFALAEWARRDACVMLKTAAGPLLVHDPWEQEHL